VSGTPRLLSIGELAERSGVATTALRYDDALGLVRPATRPSGRRRYAESAVAEVGAILFFREVLAHGQRCPAGGPMRCSRFWSIIGGQLRGLSQEESHARVH